MDIQKLNLNDWLLFIMNFQIFFIGHLQKTKSFFISLKKCLEKRKKTWIFFLPFFFSLGCMFEWYVYRFFWVLALKMLEMEKQSGMVATFDIIGAHRKLNKKQYYCSWSDCLIFFWSSSIPDWNVFPKIYDLCWAAPSEKNKLSLQMRQFLRRWRTSHCFHFFIKTPRLYHARPNFHRLFTMNGEMWCNIRNPMKPSTPTSYPRLGFRPRL